VHMGSPTARGSSSARHLRGEDVAFRPTERPPRNSTRFAAPYPARGCERFEMNLAVSPRITRGRRGWLGLTPWKTCTSYPLASLLGALSSGSFFPVAPLSGATIKRSYQQRADPKRGPFAQGGLLVGDGADCKRVVECASDRLKGLAHRDGPRIVC